MPWICYMKNNVKIQKSNDIESAAKNDKILGTIFRDFYFRSIIHSFRVDNAFLRLHTSSDTISYTHDMHMCDENQKQKTHQ